MTCRVLAGSGHRDDGVISLWPYHFAYRGEQSYLSVTSVFTMPGGVRFYSNHGFSLTPEQASNIKTVLTSDQGSDKKIAYLRCVAGLLAAAESRAVEDTQTRM